MVKDKTLYDRLEVDPSTSIDDIKKKGKKLLIKWHPDKHPDNVEQATKKFQEIQEALSYLDTPEKKEMYDRFGMEGAKGMGDGNSPFGEGFPFGGGGFPFGGGGFSFGGGGFPFGGGGFPFGEQQTRQEKEDIIHKLNVTLTQIYKEETIDIKYNQKISCGKCNGEGTKNGIKSDCKNCGGKGVQLKQIRMGPILQQSLAPCGSCNGKGKHIQEENKCGTCLGATYTIKEKVLPVQMKNGFGNGLKIQLEGKGNNINGVKSDLVLVINEVEDNVFKRSNSDLIVDINLKLYQALFGFDKVLTHLDGRKLHLHHTGKTNYSKVRKISGEGMYDLRTKTKGDLILIFKFDLPTITNETLMKALMLVDKNESINEKEILTKTDLLKTVMLDINEKEYNKNEPQQEEEEHPQQCVQQ